MNDMPKKFCPECQKNGQKSRIMIGLSRTTKLMIPRPYYDEEGNYVCSKNPNTRITEYSCSNGHKWEEHNKICRDD